MILIDRRAKHDSDAGTWPAFGVDFGEMDNALVKAVNAGTHKPQSGKYDQQNNCDNDEELPAFRHFKGKEIIVITREPEI
jgi:hypothetical protein